MNITAKRTDLILVLLADRFNAEWCSYFGEPGYTDPEKGVILANWNDVPKRIADYLEAAGFELEWYDEWAIDYEHDKAYRTQPNSYHWESSIRWTEDGCMLTPDDSPSDWIDEFKIYDQGQLGTLGALPSWITEQDLEDAGYEKFPDEGSPDFENGWFPGQRDDPKSIANSIFDNMSDVDCIVFRITEQSQFYVKFQAWFTRREVE